MNNLTEIGDGRVRLSNAELKRRAAKAIYEANIIVFDSLPKLIADIIANKAWEESGHASFADFALDTKSGGLGVNTNQRLWLLRCAMDVHGEHVGEWAEVIKKVEKMVRMMAKTEGIPISNFKGNSLEALAKGTDESSEVAAHYGKVTYLPSVAGQCDDRHLFRLSKNHPETFQRVLAGELSPRKGMLAARHTDGERVNHDNDAVRMKSTFRRMTEVERGEFLAWIKSEFGIT